MELSTRIMELVAVGASITANCQPCLRSHSEKAIAAGATLAEVAAAIEVGNRVRKGAAAKMDAFSSELAAAPAGAQVVLTAGGRDYLGP